MPTLHDFNQQYDAALKAFKQSNGNLASDVLTMAQIRESVAA